ncbi:hypothetical protein KR767_18870 [Luteibacter anthropi]|uniref:hypothetical protein n=1 Tax=Luteibacter anthropi TaxID=564369 RepID=UPI002032C0F3|nr:hypothetical protein [Luteibacter anthropi]URX62084.1 hypothetical protein KR767_18870 [Luteibacter anthropi]
MDASSEPAPAADNTDGQALSFSLFEEISSFLLWASTRWPALALYGLVLATMLWTDFIQLFDLPVSFVSPGMLTALAAFIPVPAKKRGVTRRSKPRPRTGK